MFLQAIIRIIFVKLRLHSEGLIGLLWLVSRLGSVVAVSATSFKDVVDSLRFLTPIAADILTSGTLYAFKSRQRERISRVCCRQWLPESPRFDIARGMPDRAMATLERVARENGKPMPLGKLVDVVAEVYLRTCHTPRPADLSSVLGGNALSCC